MKISGVQKCFLILTVAGAAMFVVMMAVKFLCGGLVFVQNFSMFKAAAVEAAECL